MKITPSLVSNEVEVVVLLIINQHKHTLCMILGITKGSNTRHFYDLRKQPEMALDCGAGRDCFHRCPAQCITKFFFFNFWNPTHPIFLLLLMIFYCPRYRSMSLSDIYRNHFAHWQFLLCTITFANTDYKLVRWPSRVLGEFFVSRHLFVSSGNRHSHKFDLHVSFGTVHLKMTACTQQMKGQIKQLLDCPILLKLTKRQLRAWSRRWYVPACLC